MDITWRDQTWFWSRSSLKDRVLRHHLTLCHAPALLNLTTVFQTGSLSHRDLFGTFFFFSEVGLTFEERKPGQQNKSCFHKPLKMPFSASVVYDMLTECREHCCPSHGEDTVHKRWAVINVELQIEVDILALKFRMVLVMVAHAFNPYLKRQG